MTTKRMTDKPEPKKKKKKKKSGYNRDFYGKHERKNKMKKGQTLVESNGDAYEPDDSSNPFLDDDDAPF